MALRETYLPAILATVKALGDAFEWNVTLHEVAIFLEIAAAGEDGILISKLADHFGLSAATISRNTSNLGDWDSVRYKGIGLITATYDPMDRRCRPLKLTAKGKEILTKVAKVTKRECVKIGTPPVERVEET